MTEGSDGVDRQEVTDFLPLRPVELYILVALAQEDLHGYGIIRATERNSNGAVSLDPGTLYRAIKRLREAELLREADDAEEDGRGRRTYTLTPDGRRVARAEAVRLARLLEGARAGRLLDDAETAT